jgi:long-chain acyl-CoA synthetase
MAHNGRVGVDALLREAANRQPRRVALKWGERTHTYAELEHRCDGLASALVDGGLGRGDRVGLLSRNRPEMIETMFATWRAGGAIVPINPRFVVDEVTALLDDASASALVVGPEHAELVSPLRQRVGSLRQIYSIDASVDGAEPYESVISVGHEFRGRPFETKADDLAWLFYTSGTTGRSKGAMLTHGNLDAMARGWVEEMTPLTDDDVALHAAPLSHGAGFHAFALVRAAISQIIATGGSFDPAEVCTLVERERVTTTWLVPTQIRMLLAHPALAEHDLSSLRAIVYGGSPMYVSDLEDGLRRLGKVFVQLYGQGESPMTGTFLPAAEHEIGSPRLASCGRVRGGMELSIQSEDGTSLEPGRVGEICLRGPTVMRGYWNQPEESARTLRDGWLHTGDLGLVDADGYVFIKDRSKDMIISGGSNVYPREVEDALSAHPEIAEACVFGVPDPKWGEAVKAVVVPEAGSRLDASHLLEFVRPHLADYKRPKSIDFVEALPKNAYGKVLRRALRSAYWPQDGRQV